MAEQETVEGGLDEPAELEPEQGSLALAAPDDRHTRADWEAAAAGVLRKAGRLAADDPDTLVWDRLTRTTLDGIGVPPLGTPALLDDLATSGRPQRAGAWDARSHLDGPDPQALNEAALLDLDGGITSLWVELGRDDDPAAVLPVLLDGVLLDLAPVVLESAGDQVAAARALLDLVGDRTPAPGTNLGGRGGSAVQVALLAHEAGVLGVVVDAASVHDRGASDVQELGWSMATAAAHLRSLTAAGLTVAEAAGLVEFRYAATDEQLPTIAKLRAARRLWSRVLELSGVDDPELREQRQHVVTSRPMMSRYDPYVNMLRTTVAAFAAGVGGADAVTVLPFDSPLGRPEAFGRRIARNTHALLVHESHVAVVADPAGGAYAVERLTDDLARAAWAELGRIEQDGPDAFEERVADVVRERDRQVATRSRPITGLSEFPQVAEELPQRTPSGSAAETVRRYGAGFEELRDEPAVEPVFLATLGPVAHHTALATFAGNLLAAGGIRVEPAGATDGVEQLLAAYAGQRVVCLAGTDAAYAEWGGEAVAALRAAGAEHIVVAGRPRDDADDSCAAGVDAIAFLTRTRGILAGTAPIGAEVPA